MTDKMSIYEPRYAQLLKNIRLTLSLISILALMLLYQNCNHGFEANDIGSEDYGHEFSRSAADIPAVNLKTPVVASGKFDQLMNSDKSISLRCLEPEEELAQKFPSLLTKNEISNGLSSILGINNPLAGYPAQNGASGYEQSNRVFFEETYYSTINSIAASVATQFVNSIKSNNNSLWKCNIQSTCLGIINTRIAKYLWRRPLVDSEKKNVAALIANYTNPEQKIIELISFLISSPQFFTKNLTLNTANNGEQSNLWDYAASMSFILADSFPPIKLSDAIESGDMSSQEEIFEYAKIYIKSDFVQKNLVNNFLGVWLDYKYALESSQKFDDEDVRSIASQSSQMVSSILENNEPLASLLSHSSGGILRSKLFARSTFGSSKDSDPVKRGIYVLKGLLCYEFPNLSAATEDEISNVSNSASFPVNGNNMDIIKFHSQNAKCAVCHNFIDPAAIGLENIGPFGNIRDKYPNGSNITFNDTPFAGQRYSNQAEYIKILSETFDFQHCFSQKLHLKVSALAPNARTNSCFMSELHQGKTNLGLSDLILNILKTSLVSRINRPVYQ